MVVLDCDYSCNHDIESRWLSVFKYAFVTISCSSIKVLTGDIVAT